jgi:molybdopterin converting factor small subunit
MQLSILYFAALAETYAPQTLTLTEPIRLHDLWQQLHPEHPPVRLCVAVNQCYVPWDFLLTEDAEVAFFPPVTGG